MKTAIAALMALAVVAGAPAGGAELKRQCYHGNAKLETEIGYCRALRIGNTLQVSGHVGQGEMAAAIRMAYDGLKATLAANGLDFRHVVKETVYTTDLDAFISHKDLRKLYYGDEVPAATWVQVQRLFRPAFVVEVELTAVYPE